ncbi:unnamed protein product [Ceutorhynchus assimilis]|uniref:Uncharacterized protein n=1 Tax=Ceutorhynchus assimilis TaxID=467358 RepID=A0A9N9MY17_9CUCU|nr:unnamed protein product [Ceutorhynchus assimilis]
MNCLIAVILVISIVMNAIILAALEPLYSRGAKKRKIHTSSGKCRDQKYRSQWESEFKWLKPVNDNPRQGQCSACSRVLRANIGVIKRHGEGAKHQQNVKNIQCQLNLRDFIKKNATDSKVKRAELKLCGFLAEHNIAFLANDHLVPLLQDCFPDSNILKNVKLGRTKATGVTKNVTPSTSTADGHFSDLEVSRHSSTKDTESEHRIDTQDPVVTDLNETPLSPPTVIDSIDEKPSLLSAIPRPATPTESLTANSIQSSQSLESSVASFQSTSTTDKKNPKVVMIQRCLRNFRVKRSNIIRFVQLITGKLESGKVMNMNNLGWHEKREIHRFAYHVLEDFINVEIIENYKVVYFQQLVQRYKALLREFGEGKMKSEDINNYRSEYLEKKVVKNFGDRLTIEASTGQSCRKIVYNTDIDVNVMASKTNFLEIKDESKFEDVAFDLRNCVKTINCNPLPSHLIADNIIDGECEIPEKLFDFVLNLIGGPQAYDKIGKENQTQRHVVVQ